MHARRDFKHLDHGPLLEEIRHDRTLIWHQITIKQHAVRVALHDGKKVALRLRQMHVRMSPVKLNFSEPANRIAAPFVDTIWRFSFLVHSFPFRPREHTHYQGLT